MPIELIAPAKLNLFLVVGAVRPDGYHSVTTVLTALDAGDAVSVSPADSLTVVCEPDVGVPQTENLAWRAAVAMGEAFGRRPDVSVRIEKRIPAGAGLGGGSSDAAAVIAALAADWQVDRADPRLETVARSLGADVPFFLRGGCGVYAGRGDTLRRTLPAAVGHFAIISPGVPVSTAAAYAAFDALETGPRPAPSAVSDAVCFRDPVALGAALFNNMTAASVGLVPVVGDALAFMKAAEGCLGAAMAGSGSAVFGIFADEAHAGAAAAEASERGWWSMTARPRSAGTIDETMGAPRDAGEGRRRHTGRGRR
jgi:4-diphosphocytidyl-2-C-methyl-D-erythritol kinase